MRRLAAIAAILRAATCLDAEKPTELDLVGVEILAMNGLRLRQKVIERRVVKGERLPQGPCPGTAGGLNFRHGLFQTRYLQPHPSLQCTTWAALEWADRIERSRDQSSR